jgi:predicted DNA-binding protein with PD1-like motif
MQIFFIHIHIAVSNDDGRGFDNKMDGGFIGDE